MARYLKRGRDAGLRAEDAAKVRMAVEGHGFDKPADRGRIEIAKLHGERCLRP